MNCDEAESLLHAYFDGELALPHCLDVEQHLNACAPCSARLENLRSLRREIGELYLKPPAGLEMRLRRSLKSETGAHVEISSRRFILVAAACLAIIIAGFAVFRFSRGNAKQTLPADVVAAHVRSLLQPSHLFDVPSSDQHTVKPWFNGKLDFSPPVEDFASQGFPLEGGRLDYLNKRPVAALVYGRRAHHINVFIWPAGSGTTDSSGGQSLEGYNVVHGSTGTFTYWIVSDANVADLRELARLIQSVHQ